MVWKSVNDVLLEIRKIFKELVGNMIVTDNSDPMENRNRNDKSDSTEKRKKTLLVNDTSGK